LIAVDTNLLVYAHRIGAALHKDAQRVIERAASDPGGWGVALASVGEFWSQVTHPSYPDGPSSVAQAAGFLEALTGDGGARIFMPGRNFAGRLVAQARALRVRGPRIFDLQIGLAALDAGAREMWTHDRGFLRLPGLEVMDPL